MTGNYPGTDFEIVDEGSVRKVHHLPTGMRIETGRLRADPIAVSAAYTLLHDDDVARPGEIVHVALRHLRIWLLRNYGTRQVRIPA